MSMPIKASMQSPYKGKSGVGRVFKALGYSLAGLAAALRYESAFRLLLVLAMLLIPTALYLPLPAMARALLVASSLATLIIELLNSAIEAAVDHTSLACHPLAKRAKDLGSAAQLLGLVNLAAVWALVLMG